MIRELIHSNPHCNIQFSDAGVYCISRKNCKLEYIGDTSQNIYVLLKEDKRNIKIGNLNNVPFQHTSQSNHNFDFNSAKMLIYIHKRLRRIFEAGAISLSKSLNTRPGFYTISPYMGKSILNCYNIFHLLLIYSSYIIVSLSLFLFVFLFLPPFDSNSFSINKRNINSTQYF